MVKLYTYQRNTKKYSTKQLNRNYKIQVIIDVRFLIKFTIIIVKQLFILLVENTPKKCVIVFNITKL